VKEKRLINKKNLSQYVLIRKENVMKRRYVFLRMIALVSIMILLGSIPSYAEKARGVTDDTIKIGHFVDMTGVAAAVGIPVTNGIKTHFQNINDRGGINSRKVKFIAEDDHYTIPGAFAAFKKLIFKDEVLSILTVGGTGQSFALMRQIEEHKVPVITASAAEGLTTPVKRYVFTPMASYDDGLRLIIDYIMKDLKAKNPKIALVCPDNEVGKTGLRAIEKYLSKYNLKLSNKTIINFGEIDATSQVLLLIKENPDYIILHEAVGGVISFFKAAKRYGLRSKVLGSFYVSDEDNIKVIGDAMKDALVTSSIGYWDDNAPGMAELRKITKKYDPETKWMTKSYIEGYHAAMVCVEGLKRAGRNLNHETLVEAYETFKDFNTGEISGHVSYSKNNHKGGTTNKLYKVDLKNQTFMPITEFREPAFKD